MSEDEIAFQELLEEYVAAGCPDTGWGYLDELEAELDAVDAERFGPDEG